MVWLLLGVAVIVALVRYDINMRRSPSRCVICRELTLNSGMICDVCNELTHRLRWAKERTRANGTSSGASADDPHSREHTSPRQTDDLTDAHRILGVEHSASAAQIRRAYLRLMLRHHPDKIAHLGEAAQATATRRAQIINIAYEQLMRSRSHKSASRAR